MYKSYTGKVNVKKEINKRLRRVIGDDNNDPNRRESFINENDQPGPGMPNSNPDDNDKPDDEEAKTPNDGSNNFNSVDRKTTGESLKDRGSQMLKDGKAGFKMVKQEFGKIKKSAVAAMKSTDEKEQAMNKNAYDYAQLDQTNKVAGKE